MAIKITSKNRKVRTKKTTNTSQKKGAIKEETIIRGLESSNKAEDSKKPLLIGIIAIIIVAILVAIIVKVKKPSTFGTGSEVVVSRDELNNKLNVDMKDPSGGSDIVYGIENDNIAKLSYKKVVSDGNEMNFIMRASSSTEDIENSIGLDVEFSYTRIMMTVVCDDGSEVPVESRVALDEETEEMRYMKALWYDNDKYYSMVTDNLVTREDFLQEVNRVIIANHEQF